jgi:hypothetical protein
VAPRLSFSIIQISHPHYLKCRYYGFQIKLVFDETTGLSDIEIYDCNNGESVVESENGGLEQRLSSGAGASGDCLSQVCRGPGFLGGACNSMNGSR